MSGWKHEYPLMHDPFNKRYVKLVQKGEIKYVLRRATVDDIMLAYNIDRPKALDLYRTGRSPASGIVLSRTRTREEEVTSDD